MLAIRTKFHARNSIWLVILLSTALIINFCIFILCSTAFARAQDATILVTAAFGFICVHLTSTQVSHSASMLTLSQTVLSLLGSSQKLLSIKSQSWLQVSSLHPKVLSSLPPRKWCIWIVPSSLGIMSSISQQRSQSTPSWHVRGPCRLRQSITALCIIMLSVFTDCQSGADADTIAESWISHRINSSSVLTKLSRLNATLTFARHGHQRRHWGRLSRRTSHGPREIWRKSDGFNGGTASLPKRPSILTHTHPYIAPTPAVPAHHRLSQGLYDRLPPPAHSRIDLLPSRPRQLQQPADDTDDHNRVFRPFQNFRNPLRIFLINLCPSHLQRGVLSSSMLLSAPILSFVPWPRQRE